MQSAKSYTPMNVVWASGHQGMVIQSVAARLHCHKRQVRHHPHSFVSTPKFTPCNIRFPCLPESVLLSAVVQRYASSGEMRTALSDLSTCTRERMVNHVFSNISQQVLSLSRVHPDESWHKRAVQIGTFWNEPTVTCIRRCFHLLWQTKGWG